MSVLNVNLGNKLLRTCFVYVPSGNRVIRTQGLIKIKCYYSTHGHKHRIFILKIKP